MADPATMSPELSAMIRAAHTPKVPINDTFADYVASTAFNLNLSRRMVNAFVSVAGALQRNDERNRCLINETALVALQRRGLIVYQFKAKVFEQDPPYTMWRDLCEITRAGKLTLQLLAEAGQAPHVINSMPPPPPGWEDPRIKLDLR